MLKLPILKIPIKDLLFTDNFFESLKKDDPHFTTIMSFRSNLHESALIVKFKGKIASFCSFRITGIPFSTDKIELCLKKRMIIEYFKTRLPNTVGFYVPCLVRIANWHKIDEIIWQIPINFKDCEKLKNILITHNFEYIGNSGIAYPKACMRLKVK